MEKQKKHTNFPRNSSQSHGDEIHVGFNKLRDCDDWSFNIKLTYDPKLYGTEIETVLASKVFF